MGIEAKKLIRKLDKNGDGKIGIEEFQEFFEKKAKQAAKFAAAMNKKGVDSVDLLNDEIVKKTVVISDAPAPVPEAPISSNASPSKADALQGLSEDEIVAQSMNMSVEEYRVAFGLPAGGAPPRAVSPRAASPRAVSPRAVSQDEEQARHEFNTLSGSPRGGSPKSPKKALDITEVNWDDPASIAEFEAGVKAAQRAGN